jgi:hypothetical protein
MLVRHKSLISNGLRGTHCDFRICPIVANQSPVPVSRPTSKKGGESCHLNRRGLHNSLAGSVPRAPDPVPVLPRFSEGTEDKSRPVSRPSGDNSFVIRTRLVPPVAHGFIELDEVWPSSARQPDGSIHFTRGNPVAEPRVSMGAETTPKIFDEDDLSPKPAQCRRLRTPGVGRSSSPEHAL